jgi:hypothetical protein
VTRMDGRVLNPIRSTELSPDYVVCLLRELLPLSFRESASHIREGYFAVNALP